MRRAIVDESPVLQLRGIMRMNVPVENAQDVTILCVEVDGLQFAIMLWPQQPGHE
ncbi:MAG: hypothetical protein IPM02_14640 [Betaproteobacteria bacterium]|nr:hypothetical protein [Betaproteobacteria bacterium]